MELIHRYYPDLSELQIHQFTMLYDLYMDWNAKINVISRKDIDYLYERHVLHSLGIAKFIRFKPSSKILDIGTGGGFPGIPLSILFPETSFLLIDGIGKKLKVVQAVINAIGLTNAKTKHCRIEEEQATFDFVVCRAVMRLPDLVKKVKKNIGKHPSNAIPNGLLCLKGGEMHTEIASFSKKAIIVELSDYFNEHWFKEKKIIYLPL